MAEIEFDNPEDLTQQEELPIEGPEEEPEPESVPEEEAPPAEEDRVTRIEQAVAELVDWARSSGTQRPQPQPAQPARPKPNFGSDTVASVIWDRLEEIDQKQEARWNRVEQEREESAQLQTAYASLVDQTEQYLAQRVQEGDPKLTAQDVMPIVAQMGLLKDRRIPVTRALELAYNAAAYKSAKEMARNRGQQDVRRPDAKVPAEFRPRPSGARPQARPQTPQSVAKPNSLEARTARLKREMEDLDSRVAGMSPDELQDALGE
jgi:hypothetical protein